MLRVLAIAVAAMLSGGAALAYEVCWSRALVVPLGNSTDATAMVLAGFMLGIALGAWLGGGWSEKRERPLLGYALLELSLALYALVAPWLLGALTGVAAAGGSVGGVVLRHLLALVLITLPGLAMGATLPLLVRALSPTGVELRHRISILYGANTAGAALGAVVTGFWGIAALGVWRSSMLAAGASLLAAVLAALVGRRVVRRAVVDRVAAALPRRLARWALVAAFVSGFAMLACELLWARVLTFVFGHDTYAFAALLALVLLGLSLGGFLHRALRRRDQAKLLGVLLAAFGAVQLGCFWLCARLVIERGRDPFQLDASGQLATSIWLELARELAFTPLLLLLPSVLAGAVYPTACSLYGEGADDAGRRVGIVGLVNGIGSAAGASVAASVLVTAVGIQGGFVVLAFLTAATGASLLLRAGVPTRLALVRASLPLVGVAALAFAMPRALPRRMLLEAVGPKHQRLIHYEEARTGTISVIENVIQGERQLWINAVNEVTTRLVHDQSFKLLGHLGPLLHPAPKRAVMICLGAGIAAGAALVHPLERLDVVDLSSAVARGARHFEAENNAVLDNPRLALHIDDGRQFLLNSPGGYDLAIIDSTHPKAVDSWILYTREFYQLVAARLADGGIVVQWLPLHGLSESEFKIVVRTFLDAFPDMTLWLSAGVEIYGEVGYAKLVGRKGGPLSIDRAELERRLAEPAVARDLAPYGMASVDEILDQYLAAAPALERWTEGLPAQTDDHPLLAYTTAYSHGRPMRVRSLLAVREPLGPSLASSPASTQAYDAQGLVMAGELERARALDPGGAKLALFTKQRAAAAGYYLALAERYTDDVDKLFEIGTQLGAVGELEAARRLFEQALRLRPRDFRIRLNLALLLSDLGETEASLALLSRLRSERPDAAIVHHNLGAVVLRSGDAGVAATHLEAALAIDPGATHSKLALGQARLRLGELDAAQAELEAALADDPWLPAAHDLLGSVAMRQADAQAAIEHHRRAVQLAPYEMDYRERLGLALMMGGKLEEARGCYLRVLELEPGDAVALNQLGLVAAAAERFDEATGYYLRALDRDPDYAEAAYNLGLALRGLGRNHEAVGWFCLALRIRPGLKLARRQLQELEGRDARCDG